MDEQAAADQAWAAAEEIMHRYLPAKPPGTEEVIDGKAIQALIAIGWTEGRQAGGNESRAIISRYLDGLK